jgi:hypothetical protein
MSPIAGVNCVFCLFAGQLLAESLAFRGHHYITLLNDLFSSSAKEK